MDLSDKNLDAITKKVEKDYSETISESKISALDPDFLLMLVLVAVPFDILLAILAIFDPFFGISWAIGIIVSLFPLTIIGVWDYSRSSSSARIEADAKSKYDTVMAKIQKMKSEKAAKESAAQAGRKAAEKAGAQAGKQATKQVAKSSVRRVFLGGFLKRSLIAFIGTNIPFIIGMIPWYTIWVVSTAKR